MTRMTRIYPGDGDPRHGTYNGYHNLRCWCDDCRKANAAHQRGANQRRAPLAPSDPRHGTTNAYGNYGCRCTPCRKAGSAARARHKQTRKALTA